MEFEEREGFIPVTGGKVWYKRVGATTKTPLLTLHGGPGFPHDYLEPLAALADERSVVFFDQLGCGRSDRPSDDGLWTLARSLEEVECVRSELKLENFHLLGSSWGGLLGIEYALTRPLGPQRLALSGPLVSVPRWNADAPGLKAQLPADVLATIDWHEERGFIDCPEYTAATLVFWKRHVCRLERWPDELERSLA